MEDPDFPRIAITYSLEENNQDSSAQQEEMKKLLRNIISIMILPGHYQTLSVITETSIIVWHEKERNSNNLGKQIDLVIVVDRLLTGFDAPTIQTLFVDRNLEYAGLIQAFHVRTVRIQKNKRTNCYFPKASDNGEECRGCDKTVFRS